MTADKLLSALAMCRKAGKLKIGFDAAMSAAQKDAVIVCLASDISERTKKKALLQCEDTVKIVDLPRTQTDIENAVGRKFVIAAVCDENFAKLISEQVTANKVK